jgi:hypothetical protein
MRCKQKVSAKSTVDSERGENKCYIRKTGTVSNGIYCKEENRRGNCEVF